MAPEAELTSGWDDPGVPWHPAEPGMDGAYSIPCAIAADTGIDGGAPAHPQAWCCLSMPPIAPSERPPAPLLLLPPSPSLSLSHAKALSLRCRSSQGSCRHKNVTFSKSFSPPFPSPSLRPAAAEPGMPEAPGSRDGTSRDGAQILHWPRLFSPLQGSAEQRTSLWKATAHGHRGQGTQEDAAPVGPAFPWEWGSAALRAPH